MSDVFQFKVEGNGTIWLDNLYFWMDTPTSLSSIEAKALKLYPNPEMDVLKIQGAAEGDIVEIYNLVGSLVKSVPVQGGAVSVADLSSGLYFVKINGATIKITKK